MEQRSIAHAETPEERFRRYRQHFQLELLGATVAFGGDAQRDGSSLGIELTHLARASEWRECTVQLRAGERFQDLELEHGGEITHGASGRSSLYREHLTGRVRYTTLLRWSEAEGAEIIVCDQHMPLDVVSRSRIKVNLDAFRRDAALAGTLKETKPTPAQVEPATGPASEGAPATGEMPVTPENPAPSNVESPTTTP